jgi:outer membrane usher protein FimD/PapC
VESRDYAFDALLEKTEMLVAPRRGSGLVLDFTPRARHPVLAQVTRGIPMATPLGARVLLDGDDAPLTLGRDGMLFIAELQQPRGGVVEIGARRCRFRVEPQAKGRGMARTPPLLCLREASGAY